VEDRALNRVYTGRECRELDRIAIEEFGIPGFELMMRAGRAAFSELLARWPDASCLTILCGKGNNAGDGYVIGGLAREIGMAVQLVQLGDAARETGPSSVASSSSRDRKERCVAMYWSTLCWARASRES
jgi:NAD(P)H-hydrate epimerase